MLEVCDLDQVKRHLEAHEFFWLDLHNPQPDELSQLGELLHLHPLTIEDVSTFSERPKREHYEGYVSLVIYGVDEQVAGGPAPFARGAPADLRRLGGDAAPDPVRGPRRRCGCVCAGSRCVSRG